MNFPASRTSNSTDRWLPEMLDAMHRRNAVPEAAIDKVKAHLGLRLVRRPRKQETLASCDREASGAEQEGEA